MKRSPALCVFVQIFCSAERLIVVPELTTPVVAALPGPGVTVLPLVVLAGGVGVLATGGALAAGALAAGALLPAGASVPVAGELSRLASSRSRARAESAARESALSPSVLHAPNTSAHESASGVASFRIYFVIIVSPLRYCELERAPRVLQSKSRSRAIRVP